MEPSYAHPKFDFLKENHLLSDIQQQKSAQKLVFIPRRKPHIKAKKEPPHDHFHGYACATSNVAMETVFC
jgi:hypothetical protein